jgi:hypothetical protein
MCGRRYEIPYRIENHPAAVHISVCFLPSVPPRSRLFSVALTDMMVAAWWFRIEKVFHYDVAHFRGGRRYSQLNTVRRTLARN